jgi:hypothetical protein
MSKLIKDAYRQTDRQTYIGDDLGDSQLSDLHSYFTGERQESYMSSWWEDKAHQIGYRLLLRLTRAENELAKLKQNREKDFHMNPEECLILLEDTKATILEHGLKNGFFEAELSDQGWHIYATYLPKEGQFSCRFYPPDPGSNSDWGPARVFLDVQKWDQGSVYVKAFERVIRDFQADLL